MSQEPIIQRMQEYDGTGYICYLPGCTNTGFGDTPELARQSWERGDDLGKAAWDKWFGGKWTGHEE